MGVPFNIASYALLTMMVAQVCGYEVGEFIHTFGDAHIYSNHYEQLELQLSRDIRPLPKMILNPKIKDIFDFSFEDFTLLDYNPHPHIKGKVAISSYQCEIFNNQQCLITNVAFSTRFFTNTVTIIE